MIKDYHSHDISAIWEYDNMKYIADDVTYSPSSHNKTYSEDLKYESSDENYRVKNNSDYDL